MATERLNLRTNFLKSSPQKGDEAEMFITLASTKVAFLADPALVLLLLWQLTFHWRIMGKGKLAFITISL